jgi:5-methylcytosine-specific restriction endonuclease McrA
MVRRVGLPRVSLIRRAVAQGGRAGERITPFQAKRVAARQHWRCAMCGELLQEDFECDHVVPLHQGGSVDNNIIALQALHKRCHLLKNSIEQRRS